MNPLPYEDEGNGQSVWNSVSKVLGYVEPPTEWEQGYLCARCRDGFLKFDQFPKASSRRLCLYCYAVLEQDGGFANYPQIPLPLRPRTYHGSHYTKSKKCPGCGRQIINNAKRCRQCMGKRRRKPVKS